MVIFSDGQLPVKECEVSMLDIRHVVAIVLFLINGLWKIIRSGIRSELVALLTILW